MQKAIKAIFPSFLKFIFWFVVSANAVLIFYKSLGYYAPNFGSGFLSDKEEIFKNPIYSYFFYGHISISAFILLIGVFQFSTKFREKYTQVHKQLGKIYVGLVVFVSAPSAFVMGVYATGSWLIKAGFMVASVLWWWYTYKAYLSIKNKNITAHTHYMQRSYIISLLAVFLRIYYYLLVAVIELDSPYIYTIVVYASWLPNLLVFEAWLFWKAKRQKSLAKSIVA